MDLDFKSVKALASSTRLEIINKVLESEATTTKLADEMGKSKSTVSSHLKVLTDSGLLEKDEEEGRRRVVYRPTEKARAIAEGRERKVKFSVVSSALTGIVGMFLIGKSILPVQDLMKTGGDSSQAVGQMTTQSMEQAPKAMETSQSFGIEATILILGVTLILTSVLAFGYGLILRKIRS